MLAPILATCWPRRHYPEYPLVCQRWWSCSCSPSSASSATAPATSRASGTMTGRQVGHQHYTPQLVTRPRQASCCPAPRARVTRLRARSTARGAGGACSGAATTAPRSTSASASTIRWTAAAWISTYTCNLILIFCKTYNFTRGASWCCWAAASPPAPRPPPPTTGA